MKILVVGATGMLGHKLMQCLAPRFEIVGTLRGSVRQYANHPVLGKCTLLGDTVAENFDSITKAVGTVRPDVVINAVGLIKQLPGAHDAIPSLTINSLFPHRLAQLCQAAGARLIHISTDCVFSGKKGMYNEADITDAEDLYGRSKLLGEVAGKNCLTLRTSIIGRELKTTSGLVEWFLSQRGKPASGYAKAIYTGFTTLALADIIADVLLKFPELSGIWQVSSQPINKFDLLNLVNTTMNLGVTLRRDEAFSCDRSLDSARFRSLTGYVPPSWPQMIQAMAEDPTPYEEVRKDPSC